MNTPTAAPTGTRLSPLPYSNAYVWYALGLLALVNVFNYMDRFVFSVLMQLLKADFNFTDTQLGVLTGFAFALTYACFGFVFARWADRGHRVTIVSLAMGLWSAMTAACGLAWNFTSMFFARFGVGIGEAGGIPPTHSLISDYFRPERRATAMALVTCGTFVGIALGTALGGYIGQHFGWRAAFLMLGLPGIVFALLVRLTLREPPRAASTAGGTAAAPLRVVLRTLLSRPAYVHLVLGMTISAFTTLGSLQWAPAFFMRSHGLSTAEVGLLTGLANGAGQVISLILGGILADRLCVRDLRWQLWLPALGLGTSIPLFAGAYLASDWKVSAVMFFLAAFAWGATPGPTFAAIQTLANANMRAMAVAIVMFSTQILGFGVGLVVIGSLSDHFTAQLGPDGLRYALLCTLVFAAWAIGHLLLAARNFLADGKAAAEGRQT